MHLWQVFGAIFWLKMRSCYFCAFCMSVWNLPLHTRLVKMRQQSIFFSNSITPVTIDQWYQCKSAHFLLYAPTNSGDKQPLTYKVCTTPLNRVMIGVNYSLWFWPLFLTSWPPFIFDLHVFLPLLFLTFWTLFVLASFCFGLFLVQSIHSTFDLSSIISLCCFWIFWPLVFTFTFGISDPETKWECRSCDGGGISSCKHCILIWTYQLCMVTYKHWFLLWAQPGVDFMHVG